MSESPNAAVGQSYQSSSQRFVIDFLRSYWYLIVIALVFAATFFYWWRFYAFTDQGYAPKQPIAYSHTLHAGTHALDCSYCHFNAERGRHAGVPPASVCLGCHSPEQGGVGAGLPEVEKMLSIFTADEASSYTTHDLEYFKVDGAPEAAQGQVSYEGGVVHWERIHKLPDHVYFSHEWHVGAGVSCQTCHGPVEEMDVVYQYSDLTMGWCISCHRNDNYVGGPEFDGKTMETFTVGVGDYDVIRSRIRPDDILHFKTEIDAAKAKLVADPDHGHEAAVEAAATEHGETEPSEDKVAESRDMRGGFDTSLNGTVGEDGEPEIVPTMEYFTDAQAHKMKLLLEKYPDLPRWRVQDLPETHRAFYGESDQPLGTYHNAPTHCNTCHQ